MTLSEYQKKKYGSKGVNGKEGQKTESEPSSFAEARYRVLVHDYDEYGKAVNSFGDNYRSSDSFSTMSQRLNDLEERRTSLDNYFTKNKYYDKNKTLSESMTALRTFGQNARNYENNSQKFWSQFKSEEDYNVAKYQSEKQQKYTAMTDEDLSAEIKRLSDEKESFKKKNGGKILNNFGKWYSNLDNEYGNTELKNAYDSNIRAIEDYDREIDLAKREKANRVFAEIDKLPEDVRNMLGEYVKADYEEDVKNINSVFEDPRYAEQKKNDRFYQQYAAEQISKKEKLKKNISDKLSALGYDPDKLIDYERFRYDETEAGRNKEYYAKLAAEHPVITSIGTVLASPAKGIGVLGTVADFATDSEMPANGNSPYYYLNDFTNATRESVMENTNWNGPYTEHDYFDGLYSMLMSSGDSILAGLMGGPKAGGAIIGLSAMSEGAQKIAQKGGSKELALTVGLLNGINEGLWEAISLGQFSILKEKKIKKLLSSEGMKTVVGNLMKSAGVNASEEFNTEVANIIIDYALSGNLSDYEQAYEAVIAQGMSEEEARKAAAMKMTDQALEAGYGGALQGLFMGAGATVISAVKSDAQRVAYGKSISAEERAEMYDEARAAGVDESLINKIIAADENSRARVDAANEKAVNKARAAAEKNGGEFDEASVPQKPYYNRASDARRIAQLAEAIDEANVSKIYENAEKLGINTDEYDRNSESDVNVLVEQTVSELGRILESENAAAELEARGFEIETAPAANTETKEFHRSVVEAQQIAHPTVEIDGAAQRIDSFKSVGSGAAVTAENGKTVPVTQISGSAGEVFRAAAGYSSVKTANGFVDNYAYKYRGADLAEYKEAFDTYYTAGLKGVGSFIGADRYNTRFHDVIDAAAREQIYKLGRSERSFTPGVNKMYQQKSLSRTQQTQLEILDTIGKKYNLAFIVADRLTEGNGVGGDLNGVQIGGTNRIAVSLDAEGQLYLRTAGHECYHFIEERNKAAADELHAFVIEKLKSTDGYDYNGQIDRIGRLYGLDKNNSEDLRKIESEIVADSMFDVFSDEKTVRELTGQNRSLAEKIRDFLADFISNIKAMIKKYTGSAELEALRDQCETLEDIRSSFLSALEEASENFEAGSGDKVSGEKRYSNAGERAKTADKSMLEKAKEMFKNGEASEWIRKVTGWFKHYDGKWRFEIDDSKSKFDRKGFGKFDADKLAYIDIVTKGETVSRGAEFKALWDKGINAFVKVSDIYENEALFEAYPELRDYKVSFEILPNNMGGFFNEELNRITLNYNWSDAELKDTILHELQHAVQTIEGFASGSNPESWQREIENGYDARPESVKREETRLFEQYNKLRSDNPEFVDAMEQLEKSKPTVPRGKIDFETFTKIEPDPVEWQTFDKKRNELEKAYGSSEVSKYMTLYNRLTEVIKKKGRSASELYYNTAGEIEARDAEKRADLTAEQRKNTRPDIDRTDVVFADDGVNYSYDVTQDEIDEYVEKSKSKENDKDYKKYATVSNKLISDVSNDIDLSGYSHALRDNDIRHILNSHGETTNEKYPVTLNDIKAIPYIIENYDKVYYRISNKGKPSLLYVKASDNNNIYYIEQAIENHNKENLLVNKQMIKTGTNDIPSIYVETIIEKQSKDDFLADLNKVRKEHAQSVNQNYSVTDSIPTSTEKVNNSSENSNNFKKQSRDTEYLALAKNPEKNEARLRKMVTAAAKAAGYVSLVYHGSESENRFNKFNIPAFFSSDRKVAKSYATEGTDNVYSVYLNTENFYELDGKGNPNRYIDIPDDLRKFVDAEFRDSKRGVQTDVLAEAAQNAGYNGIVFYDIGDNGFHNREWIVTDAERGFMQMTDLDNSDVYVAFAPEQVKSADLVTYDDNGNIIPLSERFNSANDDIRYSRKQVTNAQQAIESNPYLEKMVADLKSQMKLTRGFVPERKAVREYARQIRSEYNSSMSVDEISDAISEAFNIYKSMSDSEGYEYFKTHIVELAKRVLDSSRVLDEMNAFKADMKREILNELKGRRFLLSPAQVEEITYRYGSMKEFRRAWWGKGFYFSANEGTPIDTVWSDIVEASNGILDGDTVDVEQPVELVEAINGIDIEYGITDADMYNAQFQVLAAELFNTVSDLPSAKTFADKLTEKHYEELYRVKRENREALEKLKEEYELKNKSAMELVALEQRQRKEAQERSETTRKLTALLKRVSSLAANGTKNNHIPQEFLSVTKQLLESFVYVGTKDREAISANLVKFQTEYEALADKSGDNSSLVYDDHIAAEIASLIKTVTSTKNAVHTRDIRFMTNTEIELVYNTVKMVAQRISTANKRFAEGRNATVEETAESIAGELKAPRRYGNNPVAAAANEKLGNTVWSLLKPVYAFERIGSNTFNELYEDLRAGQDVYANDTYEAQAYQAELAKKYHKLDWSDKSITVELEVGGKHELTVQQLMFIYIAAQRQAYKGHLFDGGFVYEDKIRREKGRNKKGKEKEYKISDAEAHKLTEADIEMISQLLTEEQKDYAEAMRDYLAKDLAEKGNSITRKLYDMNKFIDDKYFPIMSSSEFLEFKAGSNPNYKSVLNAGMTKDLVQGANNPIVLSDFDSVWAKHVIDMTVYHSFALPLDDFNRVYNYTTKKNGAVSSIKTFLNTSCGEGATKYIETFIRDLNGGVKTDSAGVMDKLTSLFKKGAVFASASVTIQQPSAIMRATALLDTKYLAKTVLQKRDVDEMLEYCPVAKIKAMGFFDVSVSPNSSEWLTSAEPQTLKQKIKAFFDVKDSNYRDEILSKAPALADDITWAHIWNAVKAETADKTSYKGEDLLKVSAQRFAEIIDKTQVYDSVFSRSEIMRSKNSLAKMATAFMAEPTVSLNMAIEAGREIKSGNYKYGARVVGSIVSATVLNALLKAIILAMRDDDDDESIIEKYFGAFVDSFTGDLNPASYIPVIKDIDSIFHGYDIERTDMSVFSDLYNAIKQLDSGTVSTYKKVENFAGAIAAFAGLPVKNVMRDIRSVINLFGDIAAKNETTSEGMYKAFTEGVSGDWILGAIFKTASNSDRLYDAIRNGDMAEYNRLVKTYKSAASAQKAISDGIAANDERVMKAVEAKNNNEIALYVKYISEIEADGFSRKQIKSAVDSIISAEISDLYKHDNRIEQAYEAYAEGNISEYNRLVAAVVADGHSESAVKKAIEHFEEDAPSDKEVSLFSYADMNAAIETGGDYMTIIDDMIDTAKQNGKSEDDAEKSVRSALTEYWKDVYISASGSEQAAIRSKLEKTGIYDDVDETVTKWLVNSLKEDYKAAKTDAERERIRSRLYDTGYYESYEKLNKTLVGDEVEELKEAYHKAANDYDKSVIREKIYNTGYYESYDDLNKALVKPEVEELKKAWLNAADESERAIIRERIFDTGYYKSYSTLDRTLKGLQK